MLILTVHLHLPLKTPGVRSRKSNESCTASTSNLICSSRSSLHLS